MAHLEIGMNGRFFPNNWRPALQEIAFAAENGFECLQFQGKETGFTEEHLGAPMSEVSSALREAHLSTVMEIVVRLTANGRTASNLTPLEVLQANLPAIEAFACQCVHWHFVAWPLVDMPTVSALEHKVIHDLAAGVALGQKHGFKFGLEHNEPDLMLFARPQSCAMALAAVPGLHFVWDLNHTTPRDFEGYAALIPSVSMLHVSDTPLPEVNYHLPLGMGSIDFAMYSERLRQGGFSGPAILEIGGLPKSGGFGRDTDEALIDSKARLAAIQQ
jgi:L-ribulose-5-phosphate 3-epimerase